MSLVVQGDDYCENIRVSLRCFVRGKDLARRSVSSMKEHVSHSIGGISASSLCGEKLRTWVSANKTFDPPT